MNPHMQNCGLITKILRLKNAHTVTSSMTSWIFRKIFTKSEIVKFEISTIRVMTQKNFRRLNQSSDDNLDYKI